MRSTIVLALSFFFLVAKAATAASVIVFGASGQLGSEVVRELASAGHQVTAFVRPSSDLGRLKDSKVTLAKGDVLSDADVAAVFKANRFDVVVDALARGQSDPSFYDVSERLISTHAKAGGVKHMILHSSVGVGDSRVIYPKNRLAVC